MRVPLTRSCVTTAVEQAGRLAGLGVVLGALTVTALPTAAVAAPGDVDPGFGVAGTATLPLFPDAPTARRQIARDTDGRVLVAGRSGRGDVVVERVRADASRDTTFGAGGRVTVDLGTGNDDVAGIHVRDDGRIVIGASSATSLAVIGLRSDGSRDPSWGRDGIVSASVARKPTPYDPATPGDDLVTLDVFAMAPDGSVTVGGRLSDTGQAAFAKYAFLRLDAGGRRVTGFGVDGLEELEPLNSQNVGGTVLDGIAAAGDGTMLVTGADTERGGVRYVSRIQSDGRLDHRFTATVPDRLEPDLDVRPREPRPAGTGTTLLLPDGRFVVGRTGLRGYSPPERRPMLTRFLPSGAVDPSFGATGTVVDPDLRPGSAVVLADASIVALTTDGAVRRYDAAGVVVPGWGASTRGDLLVPVGRGVEVVDLDAGDRAGAVTLTTLDGDGLVVSRSSGMGALQGGSPATSALAAAQQSDGRIVVLTGVDGHAGGLARLTANGAVDRSFGRDGVVPVPTGTAVTGAGRDPFSLYGPGSQLPQSFAVDDQDRIVVATGGLVRPDGTRVFTEVRRYSSDGRTDPSWASGAPVVLAGLSSTAPQVAIGPGGTVTVLSENAAGQPVIVRLQASGAVDDGWGANGRFSTGPAPTGTVPPGSGISGAGIRVLSDGRTLAAIQGGLGAWTAMRLRTDGGLDTTYGDGGRVIRDEGSGFDENWWPTIYAPRGAVRFGSDGRVFLPDREGLVPTLRVVAADGSGTDPDVVVQPLDALPRQVSGMPVRAAVQADGRVLLAAADARGTLGVARLQPGGERDLGWGDGGVATSELEDGRLALGVPTAVEALDDGSVLVLGDAAGDGSVRRLLGGGLVAPVTPAVDVANGRIDLGQRDVLELRVRLSRPARGPVTVRVRTEDVGGTAEPIDRTLTFPPGRTSTTVPVKVLTGIDNGRLAVRLIATSDDVRTRNRPGQPAGSAIGEIRTSGRRTAPRNLDLPRVDGAVSPHDPTRLQCYTGNWEGTEGRYDFEWLRGGKPVAGETGQTIARAQSDGSGIPSITCRVTLTNALGTASAESRGFGERFPGYGVVSPLPTVNLVTVPRPSGGVQAPGGAPRKATAPTPPRARASRPRISARRVSWSAGATGAVTVRVEAVGSTVRAVRRARIPRRQTRTVVVRRTGTAGVTLPRALPTGRYRVRINAGRTTAGQAVVDATLRLRSRR